MTILGNIGTIGQFEGGLVGRGAGKGVEKGVRDGVEGKDGWEGIQPHCWKTEAGSNTQNDGLMKPFKPAN